MARAQQWQIGTVLSAASGTPPNAPTSVTSITKDAAATLSFIAPTSPGSGGSITSYTATPYIAGAVQATTTTAVGSAGSITGSNGNTYVTIPVTGLTNSTAYTFSVHASSSVGAGTESAQSGANTPLAGLVFGDDFGGPANGPIDPEWYIYNRCGFLGQSEVEYYLPSQVVLDGSSNLLLKATKSSFTGPLYASAGGGSTTQPWRSGACQSNTRTFTPTSGNTMTFEVRQQPCLQTGNLWPGLFWLEGQAFLNAWKTDPAQDTWNTTTKAEIDVAEFNAGYNSTEYLASVMTNSPTWDSVLVGGGPDFTAGMHVFSVKWKPGVTLHWFQDGTETRAAVSSGLPTSGCSFFLLLYLQILAGSQTADAQCAVDYVRVYDTAIY
jgi:hypothetical protein